MPFAPYLSILYIATCLSGDTTRIQTAKRKLYFHFLFILYQPYLFSKELLGFCFFLSICASKRVELVGKIEQINQSVVCCVVEFGVYLNVVCNLYISISYICRGVLFPLLIDNLVFVDCTNWSVLV